MRVNKDANGNLVCILTEEEKIIVNNINTEYGNTFIENYWTKFLEKRKIQRISDTKDTLIPDDFEIDNPIAISELKEVIERHRKTRIIRIGNGRTN